MVADNRPVDINDSAYDATNDRQKNDAPDEHCIVDTNNDADRYHILNDLANYDTEHLDGYSAEDEAEEMIEFCQHNEPLGDCDMCDEEALELELCHHSEHLDDCEMCEAEALEEMCEHGDYRERCEECADERLAIPECKHEFLREECGKCDIGLDCRHGNPRDNCEDCEVGLLEKEAGDACQHGFFREECDECIDHLSFCEHDEVRTACEVCLDEDIEEREAEEAFWQSEDDFSDPDEPTSTAKMWERDLKRQERRQNRMAHIADLFGEAKEGHDVDVKQPSRKRSRSGSDDGLEVNRKSSKASDDSSE